MDKCKITIKSKVGLHARPATVFVKEAKKFKSDIRIKLEDKVINGKSILEVLTLGAKHGEEIEITAQGPDEERAVQALCTIIDSADE